MAIGIFAISMAKISKVCFNKFNKLRTHVAALKLNTNWHRHKI